MTIKEIKELKEMGFTNDQIMELVKAPTGEKSIEETAPEPPIEERKEEVEEVTTPPENSTADEIKSLKEIINELKSGIIEANLLHASMPEVPHETNEDLIAKIIAPKNKEE